MATPPFWRTAHQVMCCAPLLLMLLLPTRVRATEQPLVINTGFTPPVSTVFRLVLTEACRRLGLALTFQEMPAERSIMLVSNGIDDGECCRIPAAIRNDYPELLNVPTSFFSATFSAFAKDKDLSITSWEELKPYHVGVVSGWKIMVTNIRRVSPRQYVILDSPQAMFRMLELGRLEIATFGYLSGLKLIHELNLKDIHVLQPPLATRPLHLQLHKKHAGLVPRFDKVFAEMKADGSLKRFIDQALQQELP